MLKQTHMHEQDWSSIITNFKGLEAEYNFIMPQLPPHQEKQKTVK